MSKRQKRFALLWVALGSGWVLYFGIVEGLALVSDDAMTLSRFTYEISAAWPPFVFLLGLTVGVLAEHFWRYLDIDFGIASWIPIVPRYLTLALLWFAIVVITGGGVGVFLAGLAIGLGVTRFLWLWDPRDANDRRG